MIKTIFRHLVVVNKCAEVKQDIIEMIKVFLQYGANPDIPNIKGQMIRDMELIYAPLKTLLTLESAFHKNDYQQFGILIRKI